MAQPVSPRQTIIFAGFTLGLRAMFQQVTTEEVDHLRLCAEDLGPDSRVARTIAAMAERWHSMMRRDPEVRAAWGRDLRDAMISHARPDPVDFGRRDIYG